MQARPGERPPGALGRIEAAVVDAGPQVGAPPELGECRMDSRGFAIGLEGGMAEQGDPDGVAGGLLYQVAGFDGSTPRKS